MLAGDFMDLYMTACVISNDSAASIKPDLSTIRNNLNETSLTKGKPIGVGCISDNEVTF